MEIYHRKAFDPQARIFLSANTYKERTLLLLLLLSLWSLTLVVVAIVKLHVIMLSLLLLLLVLSWSPLSSLVLLMLFKVPAGVMWSRSWCYLLRRKLCLWCYSEFVFILGKLKNMADHGKNESKQRPLDCWPNALPMLH